ncbi:hypothetical protein F9L16_09705 [Agarivorans sp. B2Z047]|nr:hypothetical protein [Agarivorans sp. B2Z047]
MRQKSYFIVCLLHQSKQTILAKAKLNKALKSDSQRFPVSLRSTKAKRRSHLNAALILGMSRLGDSNIKGIKKAAPILVQLQSNKTQGFSFR